MRKICFFASAGFTLLGLLLGGTGLYLEKDYQGFRRALGEGRAIFKMPPFISEEEKASLSDSEILKTLDEVEKRLAELGPKKIVMERFPKTTDFTLLRKEIVDSYAKISGNSWRAQAARGQLAVRDLELGIMAKAERKELEGLWKKAAAFYKEARRACERVNNAREHANCVDLTTKNYEFLVRPESQGGLGNNMSENRGDMKDQGGEPAVPLVPGVPGAGAGAGPFGRR